jgi:protein gp37
VASNSSIEWTTHTFNPWWGCTKVSPACDNCYAEAISRRFGFSIWGPESSIRTLSEEHWQEPLKWNAQAAKRSHRARVFCASMADIFEGQKEQAPLRERVWRLIEQTPHLDWLLLTKRPAKASRLVPWGNSWPENVWLGTTAENQLWADKRIPALLDAPAKVRFISAEPLLGPINIARYLRGKSSIDWVIAGGESGSGARPTDPDWIRGLRDQCERAERAFFFKQWGTWGPSPAGLIRLSKKRSGRKLDGREWDEFPLHAMG